jgi:multidrug resistance efflux pump
MATSEPGPRRQVDPDEGLFRREAIDHYLADREAGVVTAVSPPWTWTVLLVVAALSVTALALAVFARVEVTARARGMLRPIGGVHLLTSPVAGTVSQVLARSCELVQEGTALLRLESAPLQAQLLEAERQLERRQSEAGTYSRRREGVFVEQQQLLRARVAMLEEQARSMEESVALFERKLGAGRELRAVGLMSEMNVEDAQEALAQARRQLNATRQALAQTRQESSVLEAARQQEQWGREQELHAAEDRREALTFSLRQLTIQAPAGGVVEALAVKPGDVLQAGQVVGRLVPRDAALQVVSFLAEKDRAFVKPGDEVRLELDQLPYEEFGRLRGRVLRIGQDLATLLEVREALGEAAGALGPTYRVEIEVVGAPRAAPGDLRTGMLMDVRYALRRQRPITLLFEPLRRWLG